MRSKLFSIQHFIRFQSRMESKPVLRSIPLKNQLHCQILLMSWDSDALWFRRWLKLFMRWRCECSQKSLKWMALTYWITIMKCRMVRERKRISFWSLRRVFHKLLWWRELTIVEMLWISLFHPKAQLNSSKLLQMISWKNLVPSR